MSPNDRGAFDAAQVRFLTDEEKDVQAEIRLARAEMEDIRRKRQQATAAASVTGGSQPIFGAPSQEQAAIDHADIARAQLALNAATVPYEESSKKVDDLLDRLQRIRAMRTEIDSGIMQRWNIRWQKIIARSAVASAVVAIASLVTAIAALVVACGQKQ